MAVCLSPKYLESTLKDLDRRLDKKQREITVVSKKIESLERQITGAENGIVGQRLDDLRTERAQLVAKFDSLHSQYEETQSTLASHRACTTFASDQPPSNKSSCSQVHSNLESDSDVVSELAHEAALAPRSLPSTTSTLACSSTAALHSPSNQSDIDPRLVGGALGRENMDSEFKEAVSQFKLAVFATSGEDTCYVAPPVFRGVPTRRIDVGDPYWEPEWTTLEECLDEQPTIDKLKHSQRRLKTLPPEEESERDTLRRGMQHGKRNLSSIKVIREYFDPCGANYLGIHPNQLVAKELFPPDGRGLCRVWLLYSICCDLGKLDELKRRGELRMRPIEFWAWRLSVCRLQSGSSSILTDMTKLSRLPDEGAKTGDAIFRKAVLRGAAYMGRESAYDVDGTRRAGREEFHKKFRPVPTTEKE